MGGLWVLWNALGVSLWVEDTLASIGELLWTGDTVEWDVGGVSDLLLVPGAESVLVTLDLGLQVVVGSDNTDWVLQVLWNLVVLLDLLGWLVLGDASTSVLHLLVVQGGDWRTAKGTLVVVKELAEDAWVLKDIPDVLLVLERLWLVAAVDGSGIGKGREAGKDSDEDGGVEKHFDFGCLGWLM